MHPFVIEVFVMQVGEPVKVIGGVQNGDIGKIVSMQDNVVMVKFDDFETPQAYFKWELSQNGAFPPRREQRSWVEFRWNRNGSPRFYLRVWRRALMYWPKEPWWNRFEYVTR